MKTVAIIQARMGSTRLPGKVLRLLKGKPVLAHVVERVSACQEVDEVIVATTKNKHDYCIVEACDRLGVGCFRGSEDDVLDRYYQTARYHNADIIVRVTSDCPLFSPDVLTGMLKYFKNALQVNNVPDYMSNTLLRTFPRGLDAEIIRMLALQSAWRSADEPYEREHVTPYIYNHPKLFCLNNYKSPQDNSFMRWTLDTNEDWDFIANIFERCYSEGKIFTSECVIDLLAREPSLMDINAAVCQKSLTG